MRNYVSGWPQTMELTSFVCFWALSKATGEPLQCGGWNLASAQDGWCPFWLANGSWLPYHTLIKVNYMHNSKSRKQLQQFQRASILPKLEIIRKCDVGSALSSVLHSLISLLLLIRLKRNTRVRDKISFPSHVSPIYLPWHDAFLKPESWKCCLVLLCFPHYLPDLSFIL